MWLLLLTAFITISLFLSYKHKESMCDTVPTTAALTILMLYVLAIFRGMKLIYPISCVAILAVFVYFFLQKRETDLIGSIRGKTSDSQAYSDNHERLTGLPAFLQPSLISFILIIIGITIMTGSQVFSWWDDINFWSSDAKQIFFLNGFPGKYGNVSPEFGDYPPVTSLFKWLFLQLSPNAYNESLQFAGYYTLNAIFLLPLLRTFDLRSGEGYAFKKIAAGVAASVLIFMIPGIINGIIYYGTPADITMGIVYGALLYAIWDEAGHSRFVYYGRIALYTAVLLLTKSVGIEWAVFGLVFYLMLHAKRYDKESFKGIIISCIVAGSFYGSWLLFCLINRRVAKATGMGIRMATGSYSVPANALDKAWYFMLGMWTMPMHADHNITLDLSIGVMLVLIFVSLIIMIRYRILEASEKRTFSLFLVITAIITYGLIFFAHISLFQAEDQYLDAFAMTNSIARYGAPFIMGAMYLMMGTALTRTAKGFRTSAVSGESKKYDVSKENVLNNTAKDYGTSVVRGESEKYGQSNGLRASKYSITLAVIAAFILLTADYTGTFYALHGYRQVITEKMQYNRDMIDEGGQDFLSAVSGDKALWGHRVLNLRSSSFNHWVHDTYISKEASPVPVVYETLMEDDNLDSVLLKIKNSHAEYFYIEPQVVAEYGFLDEVVADGDSFETGKVYRVISDNNAIKLSSVATD